MANDPQNPWASAQDVQQPATDPWAATEQPAPSPATQESDPWSTASADSAAADPWGAASGGGQSAAGQTDWLRPAEQVEETHYSLLDPFGDGWIPLDKWVDVGIAWLVENFRPAFQAVRWPVEAALNSIEWSLQTTPALVIIAIFALLAWQLSGWRLAIGSAISLFIMGAIGAWSEAMTTLSLVLTSVFFCLLVGLPLGIHLARSDRAAAAARPVLDAMQTTPAFVYLVPIVMLFGIGNVPGVVVTIIFAMPPLIRLTNLGIRQVPGDLIEAARSFGASERQLLFKVQLPLAMPTIMAGVNQALMLGLSMVVIASMIAVGGLGQMVLRGIGRLDIGLATVGGVGIVILAIILDRMTQALGEGRGKDQPAFRDRGPIGLVRRFLHRDRRSEIA